MSAGSGVYNAGSGVYNEDGCIFARIKALNRPFPEMASPAQPRLGRPILAALLIYQNSRRGAHGAAVAHDWALLMVDEQRQSERRLLRKIFQILHPYVLRRAPRRTELQPQLRPNASLEAILVIDSA
jgi:hypothetical protein